MAEKLSDKCKGFGTNLSWLNSNGFVRISEGAGANNKKLKPGCAGVKGQETNQVVHRKYKCRS